MRAIRFVGKSKIDLIDAPMPSAKAGWVVVRTQAAAICGSDLLPYHSAEGREFIPGHEVSGVVHSIGDGVTHARSGDRVVVSAVTFCGRCKYCKSGNIVFCPEKKVLGSAMHGGFAEYLQAPESACFPLPADLSFVQGALLFDAVGTTYHAIKKVGATGFHTVALFGLGPLGIGSLLLLKKLHCRVIAVEISEYRKKMGAAFGADVIIDPRAQNVLEVIQAETSGEGPDIAIDCAGKDVTENQALDCVKKGGRVAFVGENHGTATIRPSDQFNRKELTVFGNWYCNAGEYDELIGLVRGGVAVEKIVTHRFRLEEASRAFELFVGGKSGKVIFEFA